MDDALPMDVQLALDECHSLGVWLKEQLGHDDGSATLVSLEVIRKALKREPPLWSVSEKRAIQTAQDEGLTREQIEGWRNRTMSAGTEYAAELQILCDMALRSLAPQASPELKQLRLADFLKIASKDSSLIGVPVYYAVWPQASDGQGASAGVGTSVNETAIGSSVTSDRPHEAHLTPPQGSGEIARTDAEKAAYWYNQFLAECVNNTELGKQISALTSASAQSAAGAQAVYRVLTEADIVALANAITLDVAELGDRNSPDDWPEAMLVTDKELRNIVRGNIEELPLVARPAPPAVEEPLDWDGLAIGAYQRRATDPKNRAAEIRGSEREGGGNG